LLTGNDSLIHKKAALVKRVLVRVPVKEYAKSNYQRGCSGLQSWSRLQ
jgi:hypothetical protein